MHTEQYMLFSPKTKKLFVGDSFYPTGFHICSFSIPSIKGNGESEK